MSDVWQLTVRQPEADAFETAEALGFLDVGAALSVSLFGDGDQFRVEALFESEDDAARAREQFGGVVSTLPPHDWVSETQKGLPPIEAGRFIIHGSHDAPAQGDDIIPILIDAGLAFGTGHHGTTKGCLILFDRLRIDMETPRILDIGTGAGVLAIAAAKALPDATILATDNDPDAVAVTQENMALNQVAFKSILADGFDHSDLSGKQFDLIFANILAGPLREMAGNIYAATALKGRAILSGILDEQADWVSERFRAVGFSIEPQPSLEGWTTLLALKAS